MVFTPTPSINAVDPQYVVFRGHAMPVEGVSVEADRVRGIQASPFASTSFVPFQVRVDFRLFVVQFVPSFAEVTPSLVEILCKDFTTRAPF